MTRSNPITSLASAAAMPLAAPALVARGGSGAATAAAKTSSDVSATGGHANRSLGPILAASAPERADKASMMKVIGSSDVPASIGE